MDKPPYNLNTSVLRSCVEIADVIGELKGRGLALPVPEVRKTNLIKTIHSSLLLEGNALSEAEVTEIFDGKPTRVCSKRATEVQNAIELYQRFDDWVYASQSSFKAAHQLLMKDLIGGIDAGRFRNEETTAVVQISSFNLAPKAEYVAKLMNQLFYFLRSQRAVPKLVLSCVCHYEMMFIQPFVTGNGPMARFWQQVILAQELSIFRYLAISDLIEVHHSDYCEVLRECHRQGESTAFIEFMLRLLLQSLVDYQSHAMQRPRVPQDRLHEAQHHFRDRRFSRKDYAMLHQEISLPTASRDLAMGVSVGYLKKSGHQATARYQFEVRSFEKA